MFKFGILLSDVDYNMTGIGERTLTHSSGDPDERVGSASLLAYSIRLIHHFMVSKARANTGSPTFSQNHNLMQPVGGILSAVNTRYRKINTREMSAHNVV